MFYHKNIVYHNLLNDPDPTGESIYEPLSLNTKIWIPKQQYIVLGRSQKFNLECQTEQISKHKIPVIQRKTGGGTVFLSPKVICIAFRFSRKKDQSILNYLKKGSTLIQEFLNTEFELKSQQQGSGDISICNQKILGCSLRLNLNHAFYLSSLIVNDIRPEVTQFLPPPTRSPKYRKNRDHQNFLSFLNSHLTTPISSDSLKEKISTYFKSLNNFGVFQ